MANTTMKEVWVTIQRHLNKLRWTVLTLIFSMLILLPLSNLLNWYSKIPYHILMDTIDKVHR